MSHQCTIRNCESDAVNKKVGLCPDHCTVGDTYTATSNNRAKTSRIKAAKVRRSTRVHNPGRKP